MIRGQKLINEINNYYKINNEYPKDQNDIVNLYKKAFPGENYFLNKYLQPHYQRFNKEKYYLYYKIGWSNIFIWEWLFEYDSNIKRWKIGYMQY
jgi:hypothetical protein